jgi:hypothetical protein
MGPMGSGEGSRIERRPTNLFCAWLALSCHRLTIAVVGCLDGPADLERGKDLLASSTTSAPSGLRLALRSDHRQEALHFLTDLLMGKRGLVAHCRRTVRDPDEEINRVLQGGGGTLGICAAPTLI